MEYGGEKSLNDLIEKRREDGLKAFPAANIEKVALHVARGLQVLDEFWLINWKKLKQLPNISGALFAFAVSSQ